MIFITESLNLETRANKLVNKFLLVFQEQNSTSNSNKKLEAKLQIPIRTRTFKSNSETKLKSKLCFQLLIQIPILCVVSGLWGFHTINVT